MSLTTFKKTKFYGLLFEFVSVEHVCIVPNMKHVELSSTSFITEMVAKEIPIKLDVNNKMYLKVFISETGFYRWKIKLFYL